MDDAWKKPASSGVDVDDGSVWLEFIRPTRRVLIQWDPAVSKWFVTRLWKDGDDDIHMEEVPFTTERERLALWSWLTSIDGRVHA